MDLSSHARYDRMLERERERERERESAERPAVRGGQWGSSPEELKFSDVFPLPLKVAPAPRSEQTPRTKSQNSGVPYVFSTSSLADRRTVPSVLGLLKLAPRAFAANRAQKTLRPQLHKLWRSPLSLHFSRPPATVARWRSKRAHLRKSRRPDSNRGPPSGSRGPPKGSRSQLTQTTCLLTTGCSTN